MDQGLQVTIQIFLRVEYPLIRNATERNRGVCRRLGVEQQDIKIFRISIGQGDALYVWGERRFKALEFLSQFFQGAVCDFLADDFACGGDAKHHVSTLSVRQCAKAAAGALFLCSGLLKFQSLGFARSNQDMQFFQGHDAGISIRGVPILITMDISKMKRGLLMVWALETWLAEFAQAGGDVFQCCIAQSRPDAKPEGVFHDPVSVIQRAGDAVVAPSHVRLADQVAGK